MSGFGSGRRASALVMTLLLGSAACSDVAGPNPEPEVGSVQITFARLTVGSDSDVVTTVARGGEAAITLPPGTVSINVSAEWLNAAGHTISGLTPAELELRVTGRTFTAISGTFSGTISGLVAGSNSLAMLAWDPQRNRVIFGASLSLFVLSDEGDACGGCWDY